jgi:hypothetical protein
VAQIISGGLKLAWNDVPGADYYTIYRGNVEDNLDQMQPVGSVLQGVQYWRESTTIANLSLRGAYQVVPMHVAVAADRTPTDRGRWEMDENAGPAAGDNSGNGFDAVRWLPCPPDWGMEPDTCGEMRGYMHFEAFDGHPGCAEHLRVVNNDIWYQDRFQLTTCIRIFDQPTVQTGPYYIISNNTFSTNHGGFALRIDPGWFTVNGVREYHNRLTAMVWNETLNDWMTIQSPAPQPSNPDKYSVPLNHWVEIAWVVDGFNSMLIINGHVVAVGPQFFDSGNNNAPLIIGAGYRHSTYPIEYPFRGDIDCIRIVGLDD